MCVRARDTIVAYIPGKLLLLLLPLLPPSLLLLLLLPTARELGEDSF